MFDLVREIRHTVWICTLAHLIALRDVGPQGRCTSVSIKFKNYIFNELFSHYMT